MCQHFLSICLYMCMCTLTDAKRCRSVFKYSCLLVVETNKSPHFINYPPHFKSPLLLHNFPQLIEQGVERYRSVVPVSTLYLMITDGALFSNIAAFFVWKPRNLHILSISPLNLNPPSSSTTSTTSPR